MNRRIGRSLTLLVALSVLMQAAHAEIVIVTKPLPDRQGELWPREYFDVRFAMFVMPECFMIDIGPNKVPVRPSITKVAGDPKGGAVVQKAWVNIIDLERKRYFSGSSDNWFPLDSTDVLQIREGYDTCVVLMRSCDNPEAPPDSCRTAAVSLYDSLKISDISYIVYTSLNYDRRAKAEAYAKAGYYYRTLLNYIVREVPLGQVADLSVTADSSAKAIDCSCMLNFGPKSILRVMFRGEPSRREK